MSSDSECIDLTSDCDKSTESQTQKKNKPEQKQDSQKSTSNHSSNNNSHHSSSGYAQKDPGVKNSNDKTFANFNSWGKNNKSPHTL